MRAFRAFPEATRSPDRAIVAAKCPAERRSNSRRPEPATVAAVRSPLSPSAPSVPDPASVTALTFGAVTSIRALPGSGLRRQRRPTVSAPFSMTNRRSARISGSPDARICHRSPWRTAISSDPVSVTALNLSVSCQSRAIGLPPSSIERCERSGWAIAAGGTIARGRAQASAAQAIRRIMADLRTRAAKPIRKRRSIQPVRRQV